MEVEVGTKTSAGMNQTTELLSFNIVGHSLEIKRVPDSYCKHPRGQETECVDTAVMSTSAIFPTRLLP